MRYSGVIFFFNWIFDTSHIDGATRFMFQPKERRFLPHRAVPSYGYLGF
jgi:hypothetical protein